MAVAKAQVELYEIMGMVRSHAWTTEDRYYYMVQNGYGQWWPCMKVRLQNSDRWCEIIIRNSNPFKTQAGAIKFIEKHIEKDKKRAL